MCSWVAVPVAVAESSAVAVAGFALVAGGTGIDGYGFGAGDVEATHSTVSPMQSAVLTVVPVVMVARRARPAASICCHLSSKTLEFPKAHSTHAYHWQRMAPAEAVTQGTRG